MRSLLGLAFVLVGALAASADEPTSPAEIFQSLNSEIAWNCVDFNTAANAAAAGLRAEAVVNTVENIARGRLDYFQPDADSAAFAFDLNRPCLNAMIAATSVPAAVRDRLQIALAEVAKGGKADPAPATNRSRSTVDQGGPKPLSAISPGGDDSAVRQFFPWPPPGPSAAHIEDLDAARGMKVASVYAKIRQRLETIGYHQFHFLAPGGFAIVTDIENIDPSGKPTANRWQKSIGRLTNVDLVSIVRGVLAGDLGHYRVLVIILTNDSSPFSDKPFNEKLVESWKALGKPLIQPDLLSDDITAAHHVFYLIYEFNSTKSGMQFVSSSAISWQAHLQGAGLWPLSELQ